MGGVDVVDLDGDGRTMQLIGPRRVQHWAQSYKKRAERLAAQGRMHAAGLAAVEASREAGLWDYMDDVDALRVPADLAAALGAHPPAAGNFAAFPASTQRWTLRWIKIAKTRADQNCPHPADRHAGRTQRTCPPVMRRDPHAGPVPADAWHADEVARQQGRVQMFNAARPGGLDGWTMDLAQYELMRWHILTMLDEEADPDRALPVKQVVQSAQDRFATHPLFPHGRVRNYCTFTKVDLEARCEIERLPGTSPQRITRWRPDDTAQAP